MANYGTRTIPPATPPTVNPDADSGEARTLPDAKGDSDHPGNTPDEIVPGDGDRDRPGAPDEIVPGGGDTVQPGRGPDEVQPAEAPQVDPTNGRVPAGELAKDGSEGEVLDDGRRSEIDIERGNDADSDDIASMQAETQLPPD